MRIIAHIPIRLVSIYIFPFEKIILVLRGRLYILSMRIGICDNMSIEEMTIEKALETVMAECGKFSMNPYAKAYYDAMPESFAMYGVKGLKTQVLYFLNNVRAKGPEQKVIKQSLTKWAND